MSPDLLSVLLRTLGFVSLFQAGGAALFVWLFPARMPRSAAIVCRLGVWAAIGALVLVVLHQEMEAARMADDLSGLLDAHLQALAWRGNSGLQTLTQLSGLAMIALGLARHGRALNLVAVIGTLLLACAATLSGHTSVHPERMLLAPLLALHVLLGCFWFGALVPLLICTRRESNDDALSVLNGFSALAGPLVPCIGVAGLIMALTLLNERAQWQTTYAALLLTKMAVFMVLLGFAAWNRWRALPALGGADKQAAARHLQRSIALEYCLMFGLLGVTATMTTFFSP